VIETGVFDGDGNFDFTLTVIPLPPAVLLGAAGLAVMAVVSRMRKSGSSVQRVEGF